MEIIVTNEEKGQKIVKFLMRKTDGSKIFIYKLIRKGDIKINGKKTSQDYVICEGDVIISRALEPKDNKPIHTDIELNILYLSDDIIAVDKPKEISVHKTKQGSEDKSLIDLTRGYLAKHSLKSDFLVPVHRIDKETSGIVV